MIEATAVDFSAPPTFDNSPLWVLARQHIQKYSDVNTRSAQKRLRTQAMDYQARRAAECATRLRDPGCVVLQDPTGTGKTVVALVAALLLLKAPKGLGGQRIDRILVIAPSQAVARLWSDRARNAGFPAKEIRFQPSGQLQWGVTSRGLFIVTKTSMPEPLPLVGRERLLVIVDEAHKGLGSFDKPFHVRTSAVAASARALLVTATPFQLSASEFAQVLEIATPKNETAAKKLHHRTQIERYGETLVSVLRATHHLSSAPQDVQLMAAVERAKQLECVARPLKDAALADHMMSTFRRLNAGLPESPFAVPAPHPVDPGPWALFYHVARILPELTPNAQASDAYLRMLCSSHEALRSTDVFKKFQTAVPDSPLLESLTRAMRFQPHPKLNETATWAAKRLTEGRHVLIFCVYVETQKALLAAIAELTGCASAAYAPTNATQARKVHQDIFGREPGATVKPLALVVRDNLSESIDLDGGKPCIIHHDLTWNPARFTQRMGRISRASSNFWVPPASDVHVPVLKVGLDQRLYFTMKYREKLSEDMLGAMPSHLEILDDTTTTTRPYEEATAGE